MDAERRNSERRQGDQEALIADIEAAIKQALSERSSLKKNGETWLEWLGKVLTPERVLLVAVAVFTLGGRAQRLETASLEALETAKRAATTNTVLSDEIAAMRKVINAQAEIIERSESMHATKSDVFALNERIKLLVTRQEMQSVLRQELIPRLTAIERQGRP